MANSYTPPDRSTYDPGWNDPPPMSSMTTQTIAAGKPRISLNKRVAFPMQSSKAISANVKTTAEGLPLPFSTAKYQAPTSMPSMPIPEASVPVMPPPIVTSPPSVLNAQSNSIQTATGETASENFDSNTAKECSKSIFTRLIKDMTIEATKIIEIRKRLEILDQMWSENKLSDASQQILYQIAKALENNDAVVAMEKHRLLATQHINESTQWAPALRQIILSISSEIEFDSNNKTADPDIDVVQFVDVSTKSMVMENIPIVSQVPMNANSLSVSSNDNNSIPSENASQSNGENETKSRFGRFGKILHL